MLKKTVVGILVGFGLTLSVSANELKMEMDTLATSLSMLQHSFLTNDRDMALATVGKFEKDVDAYIGDEKTIRALLPDNLKSKSRIAVKSAELIDKSLDSIREILEDKEMKAINRQMYSQKEFLNIQEQCFRCHNLVRDWK